MIVKVNLSSAKKKKDDTSLFTEGVIIPITTTTLNFICMKKLWNLCYMIGILFLNHLLVYNFLN